MAFPIGDFSLMNADGGSQSLLRKPPLLPEKVDASTQ